MMPGSGSITWKHNDEQIAAESVYRYVAASTPLLTLYDQFTLDENIAFFLKFKKLKNNISIDQFADRIGLSKHRNKQLKSYSSGMRQRVKLGLAILCDAPLLLLDEPVSHLDSNAIDWYKEILSENTDGKTLIVASNSQDSEIFLCNQKIVMDDYKK